MFANVADVAGTRVVIDDDRLRWCSFMSRAQLIEPYLQHTPPRWTNDARWNDLKVKLRRSIRGYYTTSRWMLAALILITLNLVAITMNLPTFIASDGCGGTESTAINSTEGDGGECAVKVVLGMRIWVWASIGVSPLLPMITPGCVRLLNRKCVDPKVAAVCREYGLTFKSWVESVRNSDDTSTYKTRREIVL